MTLFLKALPYLMVAAAMALLVFLVNRWDNQRLERSYDAGVKAERALWESERSAAVNRAAIGAQSDTRASERAATRAKDQTAASGAASSSQTQSTVEEITRAYATTPLPACDPGGRPVQLPPGVLKGLQKARSSALRDP